MKKIAVLLAIAMIAVFALAGCAGGPATESPAPESGAPESSAPDSAAPDSAAPESGEPTTIVIGLTSDWQTLDPAYGYEVYGNLYFYATYDNLYKLEGSDLSDPKPCLAESYSLDETGTVFTFKLRPDVKFSSGNSLTSKDVAFSFNRVRNLKSNTSHHAEGIVSIETPDDSTVVITLKEKDASFLSKLSNNSFCVVDSVLVAQNGGVDTEDAATKDTAKAWLNANSAGSGPFILKKWTQNTEMVFEKNPNYWGTPAGVDQIIIKEIPDLNAQRQMLERGEIDIAFELGPEQIEAIKNKPGIKTVAYPSATCSFLLMNFDPAIGKEMANPDVQQAVRYAIDYDGFLKLAGEGALLPRSFVPSGFIGAIARPDNYRDLDKAKALMEKAGYKDGFKVTLTAAAYASEGMKWATIAQKVKEDLAPIGIEVEIQTGEVGQVINEYREGKVQFLVMHWAPDYYDLNNQLVFLPGDVVGLRANWPASANPELVDLGKQAIGEMDTEKRADLSKRMQDIVAENSPYAFILQHPKTFASSDKIDGVIFNDLCKLQLVALEVVG